MEKAADSGFPENFRFEDQALDQLNPGAGERIGNALGELKSTYGEQFVSSSREVVICDTNPLLSLSDDI